MDDPLALPSGPALACEAGDFDVGGQSGAGLTLIPLDGIAIDTPTSLIGHPVYESQPFSLCIPDDAVSLSLYGDGASDVLASSWVGSGLGEVIDTSTVQTLVRAVTPDFALPKSADVPLVPGKHTFRLVADLPMTPPTELAVRRGSLADVTTFGLNLILVDGCGVDGSDPAVFDQIAQRFQLLYGPVGVSISGLGAGRITDGSLAVLPDSMMQMLAESPITELAGHPLQPDAVNLYFVRELLSDDAAGTAGQLAGKAMGIPGLPALPGKRGVLLSVDAHRRGTQLDFAALSTTAAHEVGHWHGLRHTTERWGHPHDYVVDTPQCSAGHDANRNGLLEPWECYGSGTENLMFWFYDFDHLPTQVTAGQGFVLRSGLTMTPG